VIVAAVVFFFVVKPVNALISRLRTEPAEPSTRKCPECLSEIPKEASRCAYCTANLESAEREPAGAVA
jgi:large conductance mechanosensitive channel